MVIFRTNDDNVVAIWKTEKVCKLLNVDTDKRENMQFQEIPKDSLARGQNMSRSEVYLQQRRIFLHSLFFTSLNRRCLKGQICKSRGKFMTEVVKVMENPDGDVGAPLPCHQRIIKMMIMQCHRRDCHGENRKGSEWHWWPEQMASHPPVASIRGPIHPQTPPPPPPTPTPPTTPPPSSSLSSFTPGWRRKQSGMIIMTICLLT